MRGLFVPRREHAKNASAVSDSEIGDRQASGSRSVSWRQAAKKWCLAASNESTKGATTPDNRFAKGPCGDRSSGTRISQRAARADGFPFPSDEPERSPVSCPRRPASTVAASCVLLSVAVTQLRMELTYAIWARDKLDSHRARSAASRHGARRNVANGNCNRSVQPESQSTKGYWNLASAGINRELALRS